MSGGALSPPLCCFAPLSPSLFFPPLAHQNRAQGGDSAHIEKHWFKRSFLHSLAHFSTPVDQLNRIGSCLKSSSKHRGRRKMPLLITC